MEFFATCNGIPVHISHRGEGERTVLLLHGYLETLYIWDEFCELLVKRGLNVISTDIPGHGLSGSATVNSMQFCSQTLIAVLDKLNVSKCSIIGHSMGGYIAIEAAKLFPDRVDSVILINSTPFVDSPEKIEERKREIALIEANKLQMITRKFVPKLFAPDNRVKFEQKKLEITEAAEIHDPAGIIASIRGLMEREDNTAFIKLNKVPTLFIFGLYDTFITPQRVSDVAGFVPGHNIITLDKSGHCSFIEQPEDCLNIISKFLNIN